MIEMVNQYNQTIGYVDNVREAEEEFPDNLVIYRGGKVVVYFKEV